MEPSKLAKLIDGKAKNAVLEYGKFGQKKWPSIFVEKKQLRKVASLLRSMESTQVDTLRFLVGIPLESDLLLSYFLSSPRSELDMVLRVSVSIQSKVGQEVESLSSVWKNSEFFERELNKKFGLVFMTHRGGQ